jgi:hypothetical protein
MAQDFTYFHAIPAGQFDPSSLTADWQPVFAVGFSESIKILTMFNGADVAMDVSYDGIELHAVLPSEGTLIVDLQTNHSNNSQSGAGTLTGREGQNVWVRTSINPTFLTVGGYR